MAADFGLWAAKANPVLVEYHLILQAGEVSKLALSFALSTGQVKPPADY